MDKDWCNSCNSWTKMSKEEYKWRVIYTKSRQEKKVAAYLTEKGIKNYLPTIKTLKQWSDRKKR